MTKQLTTSLLANGLFLLAPAAQAQGTFSLGPQVGATVSNAYYINPDIYHASARTGVEAGVLGNLHLGRVSLQPALLFSQKGYYLVSGDNPALSTGRNDDDYRLNYLTLPVKVLFTPRQDGQGFQLLAGTYVAMLVGGHYARNYTFNAVTTTTAGPVVPNQSPISYQEYSAQRLDYGLLAGLGYRYKRVQVQVSYSWGLASLDVDYTYRGQAFNNPSFSLRAFQPSLAYLFPLHASTN